MKIERNNPLVSRLPHRGHAGLLHDGRTGLPTDVNPMIHWARSGSAVLRHPNLGPNRAGQARRTGHVAPNRVALQRLHVGRGAQKRFTAERVLMHCTDVSVVHHVVGDVAIVRTHVQISCYWRVASGIFHVTQVRKVSGIGSIGIAGPYPQYPVTLDKRVSPEARRRRDDLISIGVEHTLSRGLVAKAMVGTRHRIALELS